MSKWMEIRSDYYNEIEEKVHIDAWKTGDSNEEGNTIAKVSRNGTVEYLDEDAKEDEQVQEVIEGVQFDCLSENVAYPLYIADWLKQRGYDKEDGDTETGYPDGCCYVCLDEFKDAEFCDEDYMEHLLSDHDYEIYKEIFAL